MKKKEIQPKSSQSSHQHESLASVVKTVLVKDGEIPYAKSFKTPEDASKHCTKNLCLYTKRKTGCDVSCNSQIICFHNHISGNLKPSKDDLRATKRVMEAGELLVGKTYFPINSMRTG